ncbi:MAG: AbrB/MazE/SpoVT family DNA-binding domain-containing protein [Candidatus Bathyarchaeota archaeon]|nr:AbrB/MazE/SpoVT family DNA-binding domain-containing protein [Candidatus Bathyarchaeota archaeon]
MKTSENKGNEEQRKVQFTGGSTYIISLPKKWVDQNRIKKGSMIRLREEEGGVLSIIPTGSLVEQKPEEALLKVSPKDNPDSVIRKVVSAYLVGYNLIRIRAEKQQQLSTEQRYDIKNFARHMLVGTEIVTDTPSELTLQVLLSYPELSIQSALRRMSIITSSMHRDAITALKTLDHQIAKNVITTDNEVDRFTLYIIRQLKTAVQNPRIIKEIGLTNARDCLGYRLVSKSVERTADHAVNIAENILPLKRRLSAEIIKQIEEMSETAVSMFETAIDALLKQDFSLAESIIEKTKTVTSMEKKAVASSQKIDVDEVANMRLIIESVRRTAEYAADIAEVVLNLTVESIISGETAFKQS